MLRQRLASTEIYGDANVARHRPKSAQFRFYPEKITHNVTQSPPVVLSQGTVKIPKFKTKSQRPKTAVERTNNATKVGQTQSPDADELSMDRSINGSLFSSLLNSSSVSGHQSPLPASRDESENGDHYGSIFFSFHPFDSRLRAIQELSSILSSLHFRVIQTDTSLTKAARRSLIRQSNATVIFFSQEYANCRFCQDEAKASGRSCVVARLIEIQSDSAPIWLESKLARSVDFSNYSLFAWASSEILRLLMPFLPLAQSFIAKIICDFDLLRIRKNSLFPTCPTPVFSRNQFKQICVDLQNVCESRQFECLAISGPSQCGKTSIVKALLACQENHRFLSMQCHVQTIVWLNNSSKHSIGLDKSLNEDITDSILEVLDTPERKPKTFRRLGQLIDDSMLDENQRFLIVVDDAPMRMTFDRLLALKSKSLRCIFISENFRELTEFEMTRIRLTQISNMVPNEAESVLGKFDPILQHPSIVDLSLKCHSHVESILEKHSVIGFMTELIESLFRKHMENFKLICRLQFFDNKWFSQDDVAVVFGCEPSLADAVCKKWKRLGLLIEQNAGIFQVPQLILEGVEAWAKWSGLPMCTRADVRKQLVNTALAELALEKQCVGVLIQITRMADTDTFDKICRNRQGPEKSTFIHRMYHCQELSKDIVFAYLEKLSFNRSNVLTAPNINFDSLLSDLDEDSLQEFQSFLTEIQILNLRDLLKDHKFWKVKVLKSDSKLLEASIKSQMVKVHKLIKDFNFSQGELASALIAASVNGNSDIVRLLLWNGVNPDGEEDETGERAVVAASRHGHADIVGILYQNQGDVDVRNRNGFTALVSASKYNQEDVVNYLTQVVCVDPDGKSQDGSSAISEAARNGNLQIVKSLAVAGANFEVKDSNSQTPLIVASENGHLNVAEYLLILGADVTNRDSRGFTALLAAASRGHVKIVDLLLKGSHSKINEVSNSGTTALHEACRGGHVAVVKLLLSRNANACIFDKSQVNAMMVAVENGHLLLVELLSPYCYGEADRNHRGTSLILAVSNNHFEVAEYLLERGANVNAKPVLVLAARKCNAEIAQLLLRNNAKTSEVTKHWVAPIHEAVNSLKLLEILRLYGADVNARTSSGWTPLMGASLKGNVDVVSWLIVHGADVNARTFNVGATALICAARTGHYDTVRLLVAHGAGTDIRTIHGATALAIAETFGHKETANFLNSHRHDSFNRKFDVFRQDQFLRLDNPETE